MHWSLAGYEDIVGAQEFKIQGCQGNYFITYQGHVIPVWLKYAHLIGMSVHLRMSLISTLHMDMLSGCATEFLSNVYRWNRCEQDFCFRLRIKFRPWLFVGECLWPSLSKISLADCLSFHAEPITAAAMSLHIFERFRSLHSYSGLAVALSFYRILALASSKSGNVCLLGNLTTATT